MEHRPGKLHQSNKSFKSRHASKRSLKRTGRRSGEDAPAAAKHHRPSSDTLQDKVHKRKVQQAQQRKRRMDKIRSSRVEALRGAGAAPRIVAVVSGVVDVPPVTFCREAGCVGRTDIVWVSEAKVALRYIPLDLAVGGVTDEQVDLLRVADTILLWARVDDEPATLLDQLSRAWIMGVSNVVVALLPSGEPGASAKRRKLQRKAWGAAVGTVLPEGGRIVDMRSLQAPELNKLQRYICTQAARPTQWKTHRPYMYVESVVPLPGDDDGKVALQGFARGTGFDVNRLVHVPGIGTFAVECLRTAETGEVLAAVTSEEAREALEMENQESMVDCEQTWPTAEELMASARAARRLEKKKLRKRAGQKTAKGLSEHQQAWFEVVSGDEGEDDDNDDERMDVSEEDDESDESDEDDDDENLDNMMARREEDEDMRDADALLQQARDEFRFPDEVIVPADQPAFVRFRKYRALKSFRHSPWDPLENLPRAYSRLFGFERFEGAQKRVLEEAAAPEHGMHVGKRVQLVLVGVGAAAQAQMQSRAVLIVGGLLRYENQMSVLHMAVDKVTEEEEVMPSKTPVMMHVGWRRFVCRPIFSEMAFSADKFKYERFLHNERTTVASVYAPITFTKAPVMFCDPANPLRVLASGTVTHCDPNRIILKKIVFTGTPMHIRKHGATVHGMFLNRADVHYFKQVDLWTKGGRSGRVKTSVGLHGNMKCTFDGSLNPEDLVCMSLYRRVYPPAHFDLDDSERWMDVTRRAAHLE